MSRTYHHGVKAKRRLFENNLDEWHWNEGCPSWFSTRTKHKPQRNECRRLVQLVLKGEYEQLWPLDKKPIEYWW